MQRLAKLVILLVVSGEAIFWGNDESETHANKFKVNFNSTVAYIVLCELYFLLAHVASDFLQ